MGVLQVSDKNLRNSLQVQFTHGFFYFYRSRVFLFYVCASRDRVPVSDGRPFLRRKVFCYVFIEVVPFG